MATDSSGVTVRLFAAAAEAAGRDEIQVDAGSVADVTAALTKTLGDEFARILRQCALLVDGHRLEASDQVPQGSTLDVLPPFAGG